MSTPVLSRRMVLPLLLASGTGIASSGPTRSVPWRKNRYEGLAEVQRSGEDDLVPLSLLAQREDLDPASPANVELQVRFFAPEPNRKYLVQAREFEEIRHYWMESPPLPVDRPGWQVFREWYARDVLQPEKINSSSLGILVRSLDDQQRPLPLMLPAWLLRGSGKPAAAATNYELFLLSPVSYQGITATVTPPGGAPADVSSAGKSVHFDSVLPIRLECSNWADGTVRVSIQCSRANQPGRRRKFEFELHHQRGIPQ